MILEFLQSLSEMQLVGELTVLSLLIGGIIMAGGVIIAKIAKLLFHKYYAPSLPKDTAQNISKLIYFGILVISFLGFTSSQGIDLSGIMVAGGIFAVVIGFATQSVVSNLISGVFLIVEKPAKHGDTIELPDMGISGTLLDIGTFSSKVRKFDGTVTRIPNEKFFTSNIRSLTLSTVRRADATVGISYESDIDNAILVMKNEILETMPFILQIPEPEFRTEELGDSSVNIHVYVWHPRDDWSSAQPILLNTLKRALDKSGIEIPFPQRVVWSGND
ncbi:mechanosensitive ion channel family protein [Nitrosopumilus sp.]|nr:mechanosensitive ion channel family protein [Nitrosopumilus sp.]|tara:strand:- start:76 stop:900 length:825 start_codon:yes stop_codon:yes gene_type:complete